MITLIYFITVYITFICFAFMICGFLFRKTKVHSPYELLKKRRIETENYDRKVDRISSVQQIFGGSFES